MVLQNFLSKSFYFTLLVIAISLGVQSFFFKIAFILLIVIWFLQLSFVKLIKLTRNKYALSLGSLYILYVISLLWSEDLYFAYNDLLLKTPLFVFPVIMATQNIINKKQKYTLLLIYSVSNFTLNLYCFFIAFNKYLSTLNSDTFFYNNLTINMHPTYQAMYTCFSIVIILFLGLKEKKIKSFFMYPFIFIQMLFVFLLASRIQILILIILTLAFLIIRYNRRKQLIKGILYFILIIFSIGLFFNISKPLKSRYNQTVFSIKNMYNKMDDPTRLIIWSSGKQVIQENFVFGTGVGDVKNELINKYASNIIEEPINLSTIDSFRNNIYLTNSQKSYLIQLAKSKKTSYDKEYNSYIKKILNNHNKKQKRIIAKKYNFHNQYLQVFATLGVLGLALLLYVLAHPFFCFFRTGNVLSVIFVFVVATTFITESILERQAGVSFFSFFYSLLIIQPYKSE